MLFRSKSIKVIIDGGSCHNLASTELVEKLKLSIHKHKNPYNVQWLSDSGHVKIQHTVTVSFKIGHYEDTIECNVVPMTVCHMLLGRPWQFDKRAMHDGHSNTYSFKWLGKSYMLCLWLSLTMWWFSRSPLFSQDRVCGVWCCALAKVFALSVII